MRWIFVVAVVASLSACSSEGARHKAAGNVLFKQGDLEGAVREYRAAVAVVPRDANAHTLLANALFEKSLWDEARKEYQASLELDPGARAALQGLAALELRQGHAAEAKALFERMVRDEPRDGEAHAALGKLLLASGDLDGAERHLREALVHAQNDRSALYTLGLVLAKKKDPEQANAIFDRLERWRPRRWVGTIRRCSSSASPCHAASTTRPRSSAIRRSRSCGAIRASWS
jgi:Flp pilus assembly protein TadD